MTRYRVPLGFAFAAIYFFIARPHSLAALVGCTALVILGCLLRSWAAGYLFKGKRVAVGGPYAYIRNPLYMGSLLIGIGFCAALWSWPPPDAAILLWIAFAVGFGVMYRAKTKAEESELRANLGPDYVRYAGEVPAFLPLRGRVQGLGEQHFSRELYRRNREYQCVIGGAAFLMILYARYYFGV